MVPTIYYVALSAILFTIGALGVLIRRNAILIFMAVELMLNAVNINLVAFWRYLQPEQVGALAFAVLVFAVAAAAQQLILLGISLLFLTDADLPQYSWILVKVGTTGLLGGVLYLANLRMRSRVEMWRRTRKTRIRFEG